LVTSVAQSGPLWVKVIPLSNLPSHGEDARTTSPVKSTTPADPCIRYRAVVRYKDAAPLNPGMFMALPVVVWRKLRDEEREFLRHIDAHKTLLCEIGIAVCVREDHIADSAGAAQ